MPTLNIEKLKSATKAQGIPDSEVDSVLQELGVPLGVNKFELPKGFNLGETTPAASAGLVTGKENVLTKIGKFLGLAPLGEAIGRGIFRFTKEGRELKKMEQAGEVTREAVLGKAPTPGQVTGSAIQLGGLLLGGAATAIPKTIGGKIVAGGALGGTFGLGKSLEEKASVKETIGNVITTSLLGGGITGLGIGISKGARALFEKVPERIRSTIFKQSEEDLSRAWSTTARGQTLDPTLARESLNERIFGTSEGMFKYTVNKLDDFESQVQSFVKKGKLIEVPKKNSLLELLDLFRKQTKVGDLSERSNQATRLIKIFKKTSGSKIKMEDVLEARRFFDSARIGSSFRADAILSPKQDNFKQAANLLRKKLAEAGLGELMNKERMFIQFRDDILEDAVKRQNRSIISLQDLIAGGGGFAAGLSAPTSIGVATGLRAVTRPAFTTPVSQAIFELGKKIPRARPEISNLSRALTILGGTNLATGGQQNPEISRQLEDLLR